MIQFYKPSKVRNFDKTIPQLKVVGANITLNHKTVELLGYNIEFAFTEKKIYLCKGTKESYYRFKEHKRGDIRIGNTDLSSKIRRHMKITPNTASLFTLDLKNTIDEDNYTLIPLKQII